MNVSLCIVAYNEENSLEELFVNIMRQDYPHEDMELVFVDSASEDKTREIMEQFKAEHEKEFRQILILDNPGKILPCGWNEALMAFTSDVILRIDAHAEIPENFVSRNMEAIEAGEDIVGGYRPNVIKGETPGARLLLLAESSMFGSSIASYRRNQEKSYVASLFHAAYRRSVFAKVGGYNENLARTEDNEMHYRMRKAGFRLCFDPEIISYQQTRPTFRKMLKQKYANGYWIGLTLGACPGCISLFHFVPFAFILGIVLTTVLAVFQLSFLAYMMWGVYWLLAVIMAVLSVIPEKKHGLQIFLPFLFFLLHISYGVGTLIGLVKMPLWRRSHRKCERIDMVRERLQEKQKEKQHKKQIYTENELKGLQRVSLEMAKYFVDFCQRHKLLCYFCGGGCIGTLRHQGFIPWDDDLDFFMPRTDYEKMIELWRKENEDSRYQMSLSDEDKIDRNLFVTIRDRETTQVKPYQRDLDLPHGVALDVLPLDGYAPEGFRRKMQCVHALVYSLFCAQVIPETHGGFLAFGSKILLGVCRGKRLRYRIWQRAKKKMTKYPITENGFITELCSGPYYMKKKYKAEWFAGAVWKDFEDTKMPIPAGADGYLREAFGNYMELPPEEKRVAHHDASFLDLENGYEKYRGKEWLIK